MCMHALLRSDCKYLLWYYITLCLSAEPHLKPFVLLRDCVKDGSRVQVWTRHIAGLRGIAEGVLLLFDHHFNVVLQDAWEVFVPFKPHGRQRKRPKRKRKGKNRQHLAEEPSGGSCSTGGQMQSSQQYSSIVEDISSDPVSDGENSSTDCEEQTGNSHGLDPCVEAISSDSDSEVKMMRTDNSKMKENSSSCRGTEHPLQGHPCTGRHAQHHASSVGQSGEVLCALQRYPSKCRGLLKLFAAHSQRGRGTTSTPPLWQHSGLLFIRGDSVVLVARTCK